MEYNALSYVNTILVNVYENDIKLLKVSDNIKDGSAVLESIEVALSTDWSEWYIALLVKQGSKIISVPQNDWSNNYVKFPTELSPTSKFSIKIYGFKGIETRNTDFLEVSF